MTKIVEFPLKSGASMLVEIIEPESELLHIDSAGREKLIEKAGKTLESAFDGIKSAADSIVTSLRKSQYSPNEIQVEFGIKFNADAKIIIAALGSEANFKVSLTWK